MFVAGTQRLTLQDAEGLKSKIRPSVRKGAVPCFCVFIAIAQQVYADPPSRFFYPIRAGKPPSESTFIRAAPQLADLTLQASFEQSIKAGKRPSESTWVSGAPQLADLTLQGSFQDSLRLGAKATASPTIVTGAQTDPSQIVSIWTPQPTPAVIPAAVPGFVGAAQADLTQTAAQIWAPYSGPVVGAVAAAQYTWGTHAAALSVAEGVKSALFQPAAASVAVVANPVATFFAIGSQNDLSQVAATVWAASCSVDISAQIPPDIQAGGARKKLRGPYSDPRIYEAYIARCIAEREKPRVNLEAALVKEALVEEVEERHQTGYAEYDALIRENQLLERLLALETAKRNLSAIATRQRQIATQIAELEDDETRSVIMLLDEM